jgi:hypothetical protein
VPVDYTAEAPKDLQVVRENLALVKDILDPSSDIYQVQSFVKKLQSRIYPEIDKFIGGTTVVILDTLAQPLDSYQSWDITRLESFFEVHKVPSVPRSSACTCTCTSSTSIHCSSSSSSSSCTCTRTRMRMCT